MASELGELAGWRAMRAELPDTVSDGAEQEEVPEEVTMLLSMLGNEHAAYWASRYQKELAGVQLVQASGSADPMESLFVWFGRMAMLLACQEIASDELALPRDSAVVLDLGCGNGFTCEVLHAMGFKRVIGTDYCPQAGMAAAGGMDPHSDAESVASAADSTAEWGTEYLVDDILRTRLPRQSVDVIHDSGTLDSIAMTLSTGSAATVDPFDPPSSVHGRKTCGEAEGPEEARASVMGREGNAEELPHGSEEELVGEGTEGYFRNVAALLRPRGHLLLRTCNHSQGELEREAAKGGLRLVRPCAPVGEGGVLSLLYQKA